MSAKKQQFDQNSAFAKSFKTPLFLVLAILVSLTFIAVVVTTLTMGLGLAAILALVFSGVATLCAWLTFGTAVTKGKLIGLRLYLAYRKIMNTIAMVFVIIFGAMIVAGAFVVASMSDMIEDELVPSLEEARPELEEFVDQREDLENEMDEVEDEDYEDAMEEMPEMLKTYYALMGIEDADDLKEASEKSMEFAFDGAEWMLDNWDDIIEFLEEDFMTLAIYVAAGYVFVIVAMCFISSSLKKTSKYIRALAEGRFGKKKAPFIVSFIGGGLAAIGGVVLIVFNVPFMGISALLTAATVILFAIFFKEMETARKNEIDDMIQETAAPVAPVEAAPVVETPVEEEIYVEIAPVVEAPAEEAPVEEAPVEEAPVEEAPVEEAPAEDPAQAE